MNEQPGRIRILQPGRHGDGSHSVIAPAPPPPGTAPGRSGSAPGHGSAPPGHGGAPPGLASVAALAALAATSASGTPGPPSPPPVGSVTDLGATVGTGTVAQQNYTLSAGDAILVTYAFGGTVTATITDSAGNDYSTVSGSGTTTNGRTGGWGFTTIVTPATFIRVTIGASQRYVMRVFRLSKLPASGALDKSAAASGGTAAVSSGPTGTLAQGAEIAFELLTVDQNGGTWAADFTHDLGYLDPSTILGIGAGWKQTTTTAPVTATPTIVPGIGGASWWCTVLTFKLQ